VAPIRALAGVLLLALPPVLAASDSLRAHFLAALSAPGASGDADSAGLRAYLLYPYVEAARLRHALSRVPDRARAEELEARIRDFLAREGEAPVTRDLRRDFLAYLGARRAWKAFLREAPPPAADAALQCYALSARRETGDTAGVREAAVALWMEHRDVPEPCAPLFQWVDAPERLSDAEIEQRGIKAAQLRSRLPKALAHLPRPRRAVVEAWERLMANPGGELRRIAAAGTPAAPDPDLAPAILEAFSRVARRDSRAARALYPELSRLPALDAAARGALAREYALGLAYDFDAEAIDVFRSVPSEALNVLAHEWRLRAALWHGQWARAEEWLAALPPGQAAEPRWRYWRARALERRKEAGAQALYAEVAREREYYAFLAAERIGRAPELRPVALPADEAELERLGRLAPMRRARELVACELAEHAAFELRYALRDAPAATTAQAARLVAAWGWHEQAVRLLAEVQQWDDLWLRFPLPHEEEVSAAAKAASLPPEWVHAVLRTESLYNPRAVSSAGALGLLQLRLPTARQVARRHGLPAPARDDLFRPGPNLLLGAHYLREMLERFGGRYILALAAYNAGPSRVPRWLPAAAVDGDIWVENIPYNETRAYVQRALSSMVILGWRRDGKPARILPELAPVQAAPEPGRSCCAGGSP
jgi:soluble lytic murein transglycosylase